MLLSNIRTSAEFRCKHMLPECLWKRVFVPGMQKHMYNYICYTVSKSLRKYFFFYTHRVNITRVSSEFITDADIYCTIIQICGGQFSWFLGVLLGMSFLRSSFFSFGKKDTYFKNFVDDLNSWKRLSMDITKTKPSWIFMI